ncbi:beta-N-acetylhexosaminidase [Salibacterium aidingense]|uniref:beta-N-acetylhexosaminidase n=1 Tax=Salibacterium aidingense TaxID=384933 RepID=UPI00042A7CED|nr:beta-N-acetylhexosaminidase [Salibacterium aidingense]
MKRFLLVITLIGTAVLAGCMEENHAPPEAAPFKTDTSEEPHRQGIEDPVKAKVQSMSLEEKAAQMMYVGVQGTSLSSGERSMIQEEAGGIFLLGGNIESAEQLRQYTADIIQADENGSIPLFLGVDEEGGSVSRIPDTIENFPPNAVIGESADEEVTKEIGRLLAEKVKAFRFNMDFAPVLDINNNPDNPVIGDRSFGDHPELVTSLGTAVMHGIAEEQVIPVVKHFPGHGDTSTDSHISLPRIDKSKQTVKSFEMAPFRKAIKEGADMVMVAHILFPQIDDQYPSSLSRPIITGLLREDLNFNGVVITDDMTMGAIAENYGMAEAAVRSVKAGSDMVMMADTRNGKFSEVQQALVQAVEQGDIEETRVDQSVERILRLKQKYELGNKSAPSVDTGALNEKIEETVEGLE